MIDVALTRDHVLHEEHELDGPSFPRPYALWKDMDELEASFGIWEQTKNKPIVRMTQNTVNKAFPGIFFSYHIAYIISIPHEIINELMAVATQEDYIHEQYVKRALLLDRLQTRMSPTYELKPNKGDGP